MKVHGWRIVPERRRDAAFTGEGARRYGARWNSPGRPVVYLSEHRSLAMLEVLVQRRAFQELAQRFLLFEATWEERNYLVNPAHRDFDQITLGTPDPFSFDPRLLN